MNEEPKIKAEHKRDYHRFFSFRIFRMELIFIFLLTGIFFHFSTGQDKPQQPKNFMKYGKVYRITVVSDKAWTQTGFDVIKGQMVYFEATGGICLQLGNPIAYCGPEGYSMKTVQQPVENKNIGALIGKVVQLLSVEKDEETGEEIRKEKTEFFYIGPQSQVEIPLSGKLYLGINEIVVGDNAGEYRVRMNLKEDY